MYRINQVRLPIGFKEDNLVDYLAEKLKLNKSSFTSVELYKLSIDARDKSDLHYKAGIVFDVTHKFNYTRYKNVDEYTPDDLSVDKWKGTSSHIVIVGSGPSGLFAGIRLIESGAKVTIVERGYEMSKRKKAVADLMDKGILDTKSNIQFGEGGAGTFSDGKLNTGIKSKYIRLVLETFHKNGADKNILYDARAHIGTDVLSTVIVNMREYFKSLGGRVLFETKFIDFEEKNGVLTGAVLENENKVWTEPCDKVVLAIGHSSRDTIRKLRDRSIAFKKKPFSLGYRIEHLQEDINMAQYGSSALAKQLPPADYHLVEHVGDRVVYSFCMCPGGVVVPAMSEDGTIVTNGMSYNARDGVNSNSAILVSVGINDFPSDDELSGIEMQEEIEKKAYKKSNSYKATVQTVGDFLSGKPTTTLGRVTPSYRPGFVLGSVEDVLPEFVVSALKVGIPKLANKLKCFDDKDAILTAAETRSSAPYQVVRNADMETNISGLLAIGEGAGFAGGIVSSAVEGLKCADIIIKNHNKCFE
jgi:uncharacterized FAD-dependent dehydrogenase